MNPELSKKMLSALMHMKRNNNKLVRFPGGYWAREGWHSWNGPCWGTPTVEGIVRRGYAEYTVWKDGRSGKFPIECELTKRALDEWDSLAPQALSTPEVLSTEEAESSPAIRH